jgi:hypothetical protein
MSHNLCFFLFCLQMSAVHKEAASQTKEALREAEGRAAVALSAQEELRARLGKIGEQNNGMKAMVVQVRMSTRPS